MYLNSDSENSRLSWQPNVSDRKNTDDYMVAALGIKKPLQTDSSLQSRRAYLPALCALLRHINVPYWLCLDMVFHDEGP
jgi:hypothetical protein